MTDDTPTTEAVEPFILELRLEVDRATIESVNQALEYDFEQFPDGWDIKDWARAILDGRATGYIFLAIPDPRR